MSDQNTSLPIRSEADGADERLHSKLVDYADPSGADKQMEISDKLAHVRCFGSDPAAAKIQLKLSELGYANVDGIYHATDNSLPATVGKVVHTRNATPGATHQVIRQTGITNSTVHAADVALSDGLGVPVSAANPLPVQILESGAGTEINDYDTAAAVAAAATDNHDYTVVGANGLLLKRIWASASGKMKIEVQIDPAGDDNFVTVGVGFNSTAMPNINPEFAPVQLALGAVVRVIRTNLDKQAMDMYSTIIGIEI